MRAIHDHPASPRQLMTTRLSSRPGTGQTPARHGRSGVPPRILIAGIIGLAGIVLLGLLAVPAMVGTNLFFAASAGCSGQQAGTAGQPPAGAKAGSIPAG